MLDTVKKPTPERINELEQEMLKQEQVDCPVIHRFGPGTYIREVHISANTLAVGHHQNFEQMNVFLKGRVTVLNDDGSTVDLKAPMIFVGKPGRKIGFIHEDMVWLNIYSTEETDVEKLEAHFLTKSDKWVESIEAQNKLNLLKSDIDRKDYESFIDEYNLDSELIKKQVENTDDLIDLPHGNYKIKLGSSQIQGKGIFATANVEPCEVLAPARLNGKRTIAGRYTNHSINPNAEMIENESGDIYLVATNHISGCKGGLDGQEITTDYRKTLKLIFKKEA